MGYGITVNRKFWRLTFTVWFVGAENIANSSIGGITLRAFLTWNSLRKSDKGDNLNASCYHIVRPLTSTAVEHLDSWDSARPRPNDDGEGSDEQRLKGERPYPARVAPQSYPSPSREKKWTPGAIEKSAKVGLTGLGFEPPEPKNKKKTNRSIREVEGKPFYQFCGGKNDRVPVLFSVGLHLFMMQLIP